jgi:hypothetical protein
MSTTTRATTGELIRTVHEDDHYERHVLCNWAASGRHTPLPRPGVRKAGKASTGIKKRRDPASAAGDVRRRDRSATAATGTPGAARE